MGHKENKLKGMANEAAGNIRQGVGDALDNEQMQAEGKAQELKGETQQKAADAARHSEGVANEAGGNIKQGVGDLIDNEQMEAEGKAQELKGKAQKRTS